MSRRTRIVAGVVGVLLGVPALALAASFVFGQFSGQTSFLDATASARILAVSGNVGPGGVDCTSAARTGDGDFAVSPVARRVRAQGQPDVVTTGSCEIRVKVLNTGNTPITPGVATSQLPNGWGFDIPPTSRGAATIAGGSEGLVTIRVSAYGDAAAGGIAGTLTSEIGAPAGP